jgi:GNAT superfamily N-acetyltransferase
MARRQLARPSLVFYLASAGVTAVTIRFATLDEQAALEELQFRASVALSTYRADILSHPDVIHIPLKQFEQRRIRVAEHSSAIVGFIALLSPEERVSELDGLFVDPDWWRQGIASALIRDARDIARVENAHAIHVVANPDAVAFYRSCGFVTVGETQTRFGPAPRMLYSTV